MHKLCFTCSRFEYEKLTFIWFQWYSHYFNISINQYSQEKGGIGLAIIIHCKGAGKKVRQKCIHYWFYCDEYDRYRLVICRKDQQSWKSIASTFSINLGVKITASIRALRIALFDRSWYHFHRVNQVLMPKHVTCPKTLENTLLGI